MKNLSKLVLALLCTVIFPFLVGSVDVSASVLSENQFFYKDLTKPDQVEINNNYGVIYADDTVKNITLSHSKATSGDVVRVDIAFDEQIVKETGWTVITIAHEDDLYSEFTYMVQYDDLNHYTYFPVSHNTKDGRYYIKELSTNGTLLDGKSFTTSVDSDDEILKEKYFDVEVEKNIKANFTISSTELKVDETTTFTLEFNSSKIIGEYINVQFVTERGNFKSYNLDKISDSLYSRTIKNTEKSEKGKYTLKTIVVYDDYNQVVGLKADYITLNANSINLLGGNGDYIKPVIKTARISKDSGITGEDIEFEFELESPDEITGLKVEIEGGVGLYETTIEVVKTDEKKYKAVLPSYELELYKIQDEIEYSFKISAIDSSYNSSEWHGSDNLKAVRQNDSNIDHPEILRIYAEEEEVTRGDSGIFYVEVKRTNNPIKSIKVSYMSTDYWLWWNYELDESNIVEEKSDETKIVYMGTFLFSNRLKSSTFIPRYIYATTDSGYSFYRENSQIPHSFMMSEFADYSDGNFTVLPSLKNTVTQIAGSHRYRTAVEISKLSHVKADTAVLVLGTDFPDALAAGPLAYVLDAPILLSKNNDLPPATIEELNRLGVKNVIILGGNAVISEKVVEILKNLNIDVSRISGTNRFQTAIEAAKLVRSHSGVTDKVIITNSDEFADSLSVGSYASKENLPILLTRQQALSKTTKTALEDFKVKDVLIMGGEAAVSTAVEEEIRSMGIEVKRISGVNRYMTAMNSAKEYYPTTNTTIIASGEEFADALAAAPYAAKIDAPIILVRKDRLSATVKEYLLSTSITDYKVIGGDAAVSEELREVLQSMRE